MTESAVTVDGVPLRWVGRVLYAGKVRMGEVSPPQGSSDPHGFISVPAFGNGGDGKSHGEDEEAAKVAVIADAIRALKGE